MLILGVARSAFKWVFALLGYDRLTPHYHLRDFALYGQIHNRFVLDSQQRVRKYMVKLEESSFTLVYIIGEIETVHTYKAAIASLGLLAY
jgi:hypothetical protein